MTRPLFLISNDDGFRALGLKSLRRALLAHADVVICAPDTEQSSSSHALSLHRPLRLTSHGENIYSVDGTPADCVYVALHSGTRLLPRRPDAVLSGINHGLNLGQDVFYSGTVAAAREGALKGIPSLALSAAVDADFEAVGDFGAKLALALLRLATGPVLLNANVPPGRGWKVLATRLGRRIYQDEVEYRVDPRGREYMWIGGPGVSHDFVADSDTEALDQGAVGVTALVLDLWGADQQALAASIALELQRAV